LLGPESVRESGRTPPLGSWEADMEDFEILFVDDDRDILFIVEKYLARQGYPVTVVDNGIEALGMVREKNFDLVFTDFKMPEFDGLELLAAIKEYRPETEVVIVTGYGTMESAVKAMKFGSYDYIQKPFKLESLKALIDRVVEEKGLHKEPSHRTQQRNTGQRHRYDDLIGMSFKMQEVYQTIDRVSASSLFVLIQGESGTGKELAARVIHKKSHRKNRPFIPVNCGSVDDAISDSRLLDYVNGLFRASDGGTIYLDELTEMALSLQAVFMQMFEEGKIDSRIIAASRMDLDEAVENGRLRKDFFRLLSDVSIRMPPLRERKDDICLLLNHFLYQFNSRNQAKIGSVSPEAMDILLNYHWPGNVIQLSNVVERAFALGRDGVIDVHDLPPEIQTFGETIRRDER